jgi:pyruvate,water dikinase
MPGVCSLRNTLQDGSKALKWACLYRKERKQMQWIRWFHDLTIDDVPLVGGKNASLGEMIRELTPKGIKVPDGFALTAQAYFEFLRYNELEVLIHEILDGLDTHDVNELLRRTGQIRRLILSGEFPPDMEEQILDGYHTLSQRYEMRTADVAVRSSATAEDLPTASFAGQQETYLNVHGQAMLLESVKKCFASLFTPRATSYREDMGFTQFEVGLSVGIQKMVRSDLSSSGVIFTLDTETGFRDVIFLTSAYGLGENIVQGRVVPDEFYIFKPTLGMGYRPLIWKRLGAKEQRMVYDESGSKLVKNVHVSGEDRRRFSIEEDDVLTLARWSAIIEEHYSAKRAVDTPMDIEWAKDGRSGELFIVQARPETVHSQRQPLEIESYSVDEPGIPIIEGLAVGNKIAIGAVRIIPTAAQIQEFRAGEILVTDITDPDWEPIMKNAAAIVTNRGGRTSHAAIVSRELGIPAIVGTGNATEVLSTGQKVTVSCAEGETGKIYPGELAFSVSTVDVSQLPRPRTAIMMNVGSPDIAFKHAAIPNDGVGLARMEFIFANWVQVHPLALTRYDSMPAEIRRQVDDITAGYRDKVEFFVDKLAQGIGTIAAAFYPKPVILRLSDFKTNEYAHLVGGGQFEPVEANPMLGWRGASRYYHPDYREGFILELRAIQRVREQFGLTNLKVMVPFCRTPEEGQKVLDVMQAEGLPRGEGGLEVYVMAEIPSNIILAAEFAEIFDGFSIGSNDLTQLTLGVDRDSAQVAPLFDERNEAIRRSCAQLIEIAHRHGRKVGICGQAPSDFPEFAAFLVEQGIDSISLIPDAVLSTTANILAIELAIEEKQNRVVAGP